METVQFNREQIAAVAAGMARAQIDDGVEFTPADLVGALAAELDGREVDHDLASTLLGVIATLTRYIAEQHVPLDPNPLAPSKLLH